jgi:hypothetical protein
VDEVSGEVASENAEHSSVCMSTFIAHARLPRLPLSRTYTFGIARYEHATAKLHTSAPVKDSIKQEEDLEELRRKRKTNWKRQQRVRSGLRVNESLD